MNPFSRRRALVAGGGGGPPPAPPSGVYWTHGSAIFHDIADPASKEPQLTGGSAGRPATSTATIDVNAGGTGIHGFNAGGATDVKRRSSFVAQPGSTSSTFDIILGKYGSDAAGAKVAISIWSGDGATALATTVVTLGANGHSTVTFATTPGTKYRAGVSNEASLGADAGARCYVGAQKVTCAGATGKYASGNYNRLHTSHPSLKWFRNFQNYAYSGAGYWAYRTDEGQEVSPGAFLPIRTNAPDIDVEMGGNAYGTIGQTGSGITARINTDVWQDYKLQHDGLQRTNILLTGATADVKLYGQGRNSIAAAFLGTLYSAIFVADSAGFELDTTEDTTNAVAFLGDSISCYFTANPGARYGYNSTLLEDAIGRPIFNDAAGGTYIYIYDDDLHMNEVVDKLLTCNPADLVIVYTTNDWQQGTVAGPINRAEYKVGVKRCANRVHAVAPTKRVWILSAWWKTSFEGTNNSEGVTIDSYRDAAVEALAELGNPSWCRVVATKSWLNNGPDPATNPDFVAENGYDTSNVHPNTTGHSTKMMPKMAAVLADSKLVVSPATPTIATGASQTFTASGGSGTGFTWRMLVNGSGGSINASTGAYTKGPTNAQDIVMCTDSHTQVSTATIS